MRKGICVLMCVLIMTVLCACQTGRKKPTEEQTGQVPPSAEVLDGQSSISKTYDFYDVASIWCMSETFTRVRRNPYFSVEKPELSIVGNPDLVNWQYEYPVMDSDSDWFFQYSYMLWSDCRVGVYRTSFSESENHGETGEDVYYVHLIFEKKAPISTEECLPETWWYFTGKYIYTSETSATADTSLLKPGASVRSLLDSFPELGMYCKVDERFPFTVSGDVYAGPAVLMVNEGFFLITTELSEDGTDVLIKEVTKKDTLTYQDLCALFGA